MVKTKDNVIKLDDTDINILMFTTVLIKWLNPVLSRNSHQLLTMKN